MMYVRLSAGKCRIVSVFNSKCDKIKNLLNNIPQNNDGTTPLHIHSLLTREFE